MNKIERKQTRDHITQMLRYEIDELRERQFAWPGLWSLLAVTGFLAKFPAGPFFAD